MEEIFKATTTKVSVLWFSGVGHLSDYWHLSRRVVVSWRDMYHMVMIHYGDGMPIMTWRVFATALCAEVPRALCS